jgi:glycosyl transferase, family 25
MNSGPINLKCFIIHLKRADKRKVFVDDIIENMPLKSEIIDAVDGKLLSKKEINNILSKNKLYRPKYPFKINSGEIGCFLSHRKAWKQIVDQNLDAGLIIEDDVRIDKLKFIKSFEFSLSNIKKYKYIQFQVRKMSNEHDIIQTKNDLNLLRPTPSFLRTSAQLVSYDAALQLLEKTSKIDRPVDTTLQMFWKTNVKCFCINKSGISDHTYEAGGSTLSKRNTSLFGFFRNVRRFIYRIQILWISKYIKINEKK